MSTQEGQRVANGAGKVRPEDLDSIDDTLHRRGTQECSTHWSWKRIRDFYPK